MCIIDIKTTINLVLLWYKGSRWYYNCLSKLQNLPMCIPFIYQLATPFSKILWCQMNTRMQCQYHFLYYLSSVRLLGCSELHRILIWNVYSFGVLCQNWKCHPDGVEMVNLCNWIHYNLDVTFNQRSVLWMDSSWEGCVAQ